MSNLKNKINTILSESDIEIVNEGIGSIIKNFFKTKDKIKPFASEKELLDAFEVNNFPQIIASSKFLEIFENTIPNRVFIDNDEQGVYLGAFFLSSQTIINIGSDFDGSHRTRFHPFKPKRDKQ